MANRKLKVVVVDNDKESRLQLIAELQLHDELILSAEASDDLTAIQKITEVKPDLVFMDYGWFMQQDEGGWNQIKKRSGQGFEWVLLVGNCEQAQMAMVGGAFDYLMKPVQTYELEKTLLKFGVKKNSTLRAEAYKRSVLYFPESNKVCLPTSDRDIYIATDKIALLKCKQKHCILIDADNNSFEICLGLKTLIIGIPDKEIKRVHKSNAINRRFLHSTIVKKNRCFLMINGKLVEVPVSTRGRKKLKEP
jgi:two-component system, LytTR family, response regulator